MAGLPPAPSGVNTASPCARCASSPPSRATSTCASRPRRPRRKASPATRWWRRGAAAATQAEVALRGALPPACGCAAAPTATTPRAGRLEEIKTYRGDLARQPRQPPRTCTGRRLRVYGWLLCQQRGLAEIELALVYFDIAQRSARPCCAETRTRGRAARLLRGSCCERFLAWAAQELGAPRGARRGAGRAGLSARRLPPRPARAGDRPSTTPRAAAAACWRRRRPASARPSARCSRCSRPARRRRSTRSSS